MENEIKANDLMVGDWVYAKTEKGKKIAKVCWWSDKFAAAEATDGSEYTGKQFDEVFSCIEPIPLAPEILEKNGFIDNGLGQHYLKCGNSVTVRVGLSPLFHDGCWLVAADKEVDETIYTTCVLFDAKHVHELQQVMRLAKVEREIEL